MNRPLAADQYISMEFQKNNAARRVYRRNEMERLFHPRSIAIVGASDNEASFGAKTLANLRSFGGRVMVVHPRHAQLNGHACHPSIQSLPETPDCVVLAVPREAVEGLVIECAEKGVGGLVIYASGYGETGKPDRTAMQERLCAIAREADMRILGPNCMGYVNSALSINASFTSTDTVLRPPRPHAIGLVSQSGAVGFGLLQAMKHGVSFSHVMTAGNSGDVDVADEIAFLSEDPACTAIACLFEGTHAPERLIEAGELAWEHDKPLIVFKVGTGISGVEAAKSHTGTLAGSLSAYRAAFERCGMIVVDHHEALLEVAAFFSKAPAPKSNGVCVFSASGGAAIIAADKADAHGVPLPQPNAQARELLLQHVPEYGSPRNPCDLTATMGGNAAAINACADAVMADPAYGALVMPSTTPGAGMPGRIQSLGEIAARHGKIVCLPWLAGWLDGTGSLEAEENPNVALFRSADRCFSTLAAWQRRDAIRQAGARNYARTSPDQARASAAELIVRSGHDTLNEREAKAILAVYGVPVVKEQLAVDAKQAVAAAQACGFPVVLKVESPDIPHKTEADAIRLNLNSDSEVAAAYETVMSNARRWKPDAKLNGVLVQAMAGAGTEVMVGARVDPIFGPLIVVGLGGILVELMRDTAVELAPVTHREAVGMLSRLKGSAVLQGFRGMPPVDRDRLADVIVRISELISDQRNVVSEIDVNPLICAGDRVLAVDALIFRST